MVNLTPTTEALTRPPAWNGYGSAPCLADDDEPVDTLEADLAASLAALGVRPRLVP